MSFCGISKQAFWKNMCNTSYKSVTGTSLANASKNQPPSKGYLYPQAFESHVQGFEMIYWYGFSDSCH